MNCNFRFSETAANSLTLYKLYLCITSKTRYLDKLKFFNQIGHEIKRIESNRESPEIIAVLADWGQGKSSFFDIIEEVLKERKVEVNKVSFLELLRKNNFEMLKTSKISLIDEVESAVDSAVFSQYQDNIRDFWVYVKELANSKGENIVYLSMTPSAYSKIFGSGGQISTLFPETYYSFIQRIKTIQIFPPSKLEYLALMDCLFEMNSLDKGLLHYLDLPYWAISQERRKYVRLFNDIICRIIEYKEPEEQLFKEIEVAKDLNDEGETIRGEVHKLEKDMDSEEIKRFHKVLLSRIILDERLITEKLKSYVIKGFLIDYSTWIELSKGHNIPQEVEDFLIQYVPNKNFDKSLYVFLSDNLNKVIYEGVNLGNLQEIVEKAKIRSKMNAYALEWSFFESLINTNVGGLVVEFKNRTIKENAIKFVNENLLNISSEMEALEALLRAINFDIEEFSLYKNLRLVRVKINNRSYNIILYKPDSDYEKLSAVIGKDIIHGAIILGKAQPNLDSLSISVLELELPTPIKRQLLYLLFHYLHPESTRIRYDVLQLRLGDVIKSINELFSRINENLTIPQLPLTKGNKRPIQSLNWIIFSPSIFPEKYQNVFIEVNEIVNERFRIFGSKQFHLEDIETSETLKDEVLNYFKENLILNVKDDIIYYDDLAGPLVKRFAKIFTGYIKQKEGNPEELILEYIYSVTGIKDAKPRLTQVLYKIFEKSPSLDFLIYSSIFTGEVINYLNKEVIIKELKSKIEENVGEIKKVDIKLGYFITAKKRNAGIRSLREMQNSILEYYKLAEIALKNNDYKNFLRLSAVLFTLYSLFKEFLNDTVEAENKINKIRAEISKKLDIIDKAKRLLSIREELEEEREIKEIIEDNVESYVSDFQEIIAKLNKSKKYEELKNFIESIQKISGIESNNLHLLIWEIYKLSIEGSTIPFFDEIKNSKLYRNSVRLREIGSNLSRLEAEILSIEKINPEINKLKVEIQNQKNKINELIFKIKGEIRELS